MLLLLVNSSVLISCLPFVPIHRRIDLHVKVLTSFVYPLAAEHSYALLPWLIAGPGNKASMFLQMQTNAYLAGMCGSVVVYFVCSFTCTQMFDMHTVH